jgi:hypothetical protein
MWAHPRVGDAAGMTTVLDTHGDTPTRAAAPTRHGPWRLRGRTRKTVLVTHILAVGTWVGIDVLVGVLVLAGWLSGDPAVRGAAYQALGTFVVWPMLAAGVTSLLTGVILGLGSKYGLVRYWWVAVKLVLNLVLCTLILVLLRPELGELAEYGRALAAGTAAERDLGNLFFPPAVSLSALTLATVLSVAKPWGRLRRTQVSPGS